MKNATAETQHMQVLQMPPRSIPPGSTLLGLAPLPKVARPLPIVTTTPAIGTTTDKVSPHPWKEFDDIGLAPRPKVRRANAQQLVVSTYRLLGFAILTIIVIVLVGYIATTAFYYMSSSWAAPVAISASDEKVVALKAQLAEQQNARDRLAAELDDTDRAIAAEQDFQSEFARAIQSDLKGRQAALERAKQLASQAQSTRILIRDANDQYAKDHASTLSKDYDAGMIDRSAMLSGKYQLAQIHAANLSLAERQAEFEQRAAQLATETRALDAILGGQKKSSDVALSYDVLKIKRDYDNSRLESAKATEERKALQASLERHDAILKSIRQSPQLRASDRKADVAFVPYSNFEGVTPGTPVYACAVEMVICHEAGTVQAILPGEVTYKHPNRDKMLRGQMIELKLDDASAAEENVLFVGRKPLLF